jgi:hypothetical protein
MTFKHTHRVGIGGDFEPAATVHVQKTAGSLSRGVNTESSGDNLPIARYQRKYTLPTAPNNIHTNYMDISIVGDSDGGHQEGMHIGSAFKTLSLGGGNSGQSSRTMVLDDTGTVTVGSANNSNSTAAEYSPGHETNLDGHVKVLAMDNNIARISAHGCVQGCGELFVGQSSTYGCGIRYNGELADNNIQKTKNDQVVHFRRVAGVTHPVFAHSYDSENVQFFGKIRVNDSSIAQAADNQSSGKFVTSEALHVVGGCRLEGNLILDGVSSGITTSGNITAAGEITAGSDERLKEDIKPLTKSLDRVSELQGVSYKRNDQVCDDRRIGLVAQAVEAIVPEVVSTSQQNMKDSKSINYGSLVALLVEAIKEQQVQIDQLKDKVS